MHRLIINQSSVIVFWHKTPRLKELERKKIPNILALEDTSPLNVEDCSWIEWCHFYDLEFLLCVNMLCILCINELKLLHWSFNTLFFAGENPWQNWFFRASSSLSGEIRIPIVSVSTNIQTSVNEFKHWLLYWFPEVSVKRHRIFPFQQIIKDLMITLIADACPTTLPLLSLSPSLSVNSCLSLKIFMWMKPDFGVLRTH